MFPICQVGEKAEVPIVLFDLASMLPLLYCGSSITARAPHTTLLVSLWAMEQEKKKRSLETGYAPAYGFEDLVVATQNA